MPTNPRKSEVLSELCELGLLVARRVYGFPAVAADCFCTPHPEGWNFEYDQRVLDFISSAVNEKFLREGR